MGNSKSSENSKNRKLSMMLKKDKEVEDTKIKLLLLGAGESGKSTIFKQMKFLYGQGYTPADRFRMRQFVIGNVIEGAIDIADSAEKVKVKLSPEAEAQAAKLRMLEDQRVLSAETRNAIVSLWKDETFRKVWDQRAHFQVQDTWADFANKMEDNPSWGVPEDWIPTMDEVLLCRVRTTGVVDEVFTVNKVKLRMLDVGGQRNERRKWIHCFEDVTSILFVASVAEYDQQLFEDTSQNRLMESLTLWDEIVNNPAFKDAAIILFLNKTDLLSKKLAQKIPLNQSGFFPSAPSGDVPLDKALAWFEKMFRDRIKSSSVRVHTHFTCATDTQGIDVILKATAQNILIKNLETSGIAFNG